MILKGGMKNQSIKFGQSSTQVPFCVVVTTVWAIVCLVMIISYIIDMYRLDCVCERHSHFVLFSQNDNLYYLECKENYFGKLHKRKFSRYYNAPGTKG